MTNYKSTHLRYSKNVTTAETTWRTKISCNKKHKLMTHRNLSLDCKLRIWNYIQRKFIIYIYWLTWYNCSSPKNQLSSHYLLSFDIIYLALETFLCFRHSLTCFINCMKNETNLLQNFLLEFRSIWNVIRNRFANLNKNLCDFFV